MNTAELFLAQARARPNAPAIIETHGGQDRVLTFAALDDLSARGAATLRASGLRPGHAALVFQPMSIDLYVALTALFRAGIIATFLDPSAGRAHIARCCALRPPDAFLGSPKAHLLRLLSPEIRRIPCRFAFGSFPVPGAVSWASGLQRSEPTPDVEPCTPETPALLTFTSGSTGQPKAAVRTHALLAAQHAALEESIRLQPGQIDLTTLPIFALANLASGVTSLIPEGDLRRPGDIAPAPIVQQIRRHKPTRCGASPAFFERLMANERFPEFTELYTGGAPVFPVLLDRMRAAAPAARVVAVYGSTEAEPIAHIARDEMSEDDITKMVGGGGLLTGIPEPCVDLRVLRDHWGKPVGPYTAAEFEAACCPPGEPGEIVVAGAHVLPGYLNGEGDVETKFRVDGRVWHRTGDSGYRDDVGRLWLLGRASAKITDTQHGTLYPFAVECAARQQPGIRRAALVLHQEKRILLLEPEPDAAINEDTLRAALTWASLDDIRTWREIPMDRRHNAKVDYAELKRRLDRAGK